MAPPFWRRARALILAVAAALVLSMAPASGQAGSGPHEDVFVPPQARPGMRPRDVVVEDGSPHGLEPHETGLGWNYAADGGSHRGYHDALFNEGPDQGIHDPLKDRTPEEQAYVDKMWEGYHPSRIPKTADLTYAGKNRPKHRVRARVCVRVCMRACVRACVCVRVCVCACVRAPVRSFVRSRARCGIFFGHVCSVRV
jgi:hypothetical protein